VSVIRGFVFPHVCSRCASRKATREWHMTSPDIPGLGLVNKNDRWVRSYELDVPVCDLCYSALERAALARTGAMILSALLGFAFSSWLLQQLLGSAVNGVLFFLWVVVGTLLGLTFAVYIALPAIDYYLKGQVGRVTNNGRSIRFNNRSYQMLFNRMNHVVLQQDGVDQMGARP
jgi:hypothetical protein